MKLSAPSCRHHWHRRTGTDDWHCCWCPDTCVDSTRPLNRTAECFESDSFVVGDQALPPARNIVRRSRRNGRRAAA